MTPTPRLLRLPLALNHYPHSALYHPTPLRLTSTLINSRLHAKEQREEFFANLDLNTSNPSKLFRTIQKHNGLTPEPTRILHHQGMTYTNEHVLEGWEKYFAALSANDDVGEFDDNFKAEIHQEFTQLLAHPPENEVIFTEEEVAEVVESLPMHKAAGPDEIDTEHLIYGGKLLVKHLTIILNAIVATGHIPPSFTHGLVLPIPKGHNKDLSNPSNYRGISLLSNISKVLERLVLLHLQALDPPLSLNPLQGGFRPQLSCLHSAFILQETIQHLREHGKKAFVAFLDVRKAFDTVWHEGLLVKLHRRGIHGRLWHLIQAWYAQSTAAVQWDSHQSSHFPVLQGVRQGAILSPLLYCIFVDELLDNLHASGHGAKVGEVYCGAPMYADDVALIAESPDELQAMLNIVSSYATRWRYQLNPEKSAVMVFGESSRSRSTGRLNRKWYLCNSLIHETDHQHHLGILRSVLNSTIQRTNERCSAARSAFFALNAVGSRFGCLHPITTHRIYSTLCLPILLYSAELWALPKTELQIMERVHRKILRTAQGLPTRCPNAAIYSLIGSRSIASHIQQRQLSFISSIACLDDDALPKRLLQIRLSTPSVKGLIPTYRHLLDDLRLPSIDELLNQPPNRKSWKKSTRKLLSYRSYLSLMEDCVDLHIGACSIPIGRPARHWSVTLGDVKATRRSNFRIRLLTGCDGLEQDASRFRYRTQSRLPGDPTCKLCGSGPENAEHFILYCQSLDTTRRLALESAPP